MTRMAPVRKKLILVGDGACGKRRLLVTFTTNEFPNEYVPTVFDTYTANLEVDGTEVELEMSYPACQEDFRRLRVLSYPGTHVALLVFSLDSHESLENIVKIWTPEVNECCADVPKILVATKKDLRDNNGVKTIPYEQCCKVAEQINAVKYMECSAKHKDGLQELFETAVRCALEKKERNERGKCALM